MGEEGPTVKNTLHLGVNERDKGGGSRARQRVNEGLLGEVDSITRTETEANGCPAVRASKNRCDCRKSQQ